MSKIVLNDQQKEAENLIKKWWEKKEKQIFTLAGYAGTGKTFLIDYIIKETLLLKENERVIFSAPTGKAASVLIKKGHLNASTIHRLIYDAVEKEYETEINGKKVLSKKIQFQKKSEILDYKLIIVDEISMVEENILKDLVSFGIPLLCAGDIGQLPAIFKSNNLLEKPDYILTEIVRQAENNSIIKLATMARNNEEIKEGNYGDVIVIKQEDISDSAFSNILIKCDQVLCGKNSTRKYLNDFIRKIKGIDTENNKLPLKNEKLICTANNWEIFIDEEKKYNLVNGLIFFSQSNVNVLDKNLNLGAVSLKSDFIDFKTEEILFDTGIFTENEFSYYMHQRAYLLDNGSYKIKDFYKKRLPNELKKDFLKRKKEEIIKKHKAISDAEISRLEFGYCISVHKSQGSEFNKVVVFDESKVFGKNSGKWLYTAITRAKTKLIIIK